MKWSRTTKFLACALTLLVSAFVLVLVGFIEVQNNATSRKKFCLTIKQAHEFKLFSTYFNNTFCHNTNYSEVADPRFPRGGGANLPMGGQHTILPNFPKNWMKLKEFGTPGGMSKILIQYVDPPLNNTH